MLTNRANTPIGVLLDRKIEEVVGGSQSEFARWVDLPCTTINRIVQGVTYPPDADARRKLANAMGIRHVNLLVLAGELREDEIPQPGEPQPPFLRGDRWSRVVELLAEANPHPDRVQALIEILEGWKAFDEQERDRG